jgi:hypothetical protein
VIRASSTLATSVSTPAKIVAEMTDAPSATAVTPCSDGGYNGRPFIPVNSGHVPGLGAVTGMKRARSRIDAEKRFSAKRGRHLMHESIARDKGSKHGLAAPTTELSIKRLRLP